VVRRLAITWGAIDLPGERKIHTQPVPRLGGVAVLASVAVVVTAALWLSPDLRPAIASSLGAARWSVLASAALLVIVMGSVDDLVGLPARLKFLIEIAAAAAVVLVAGAPETIDFRPFAGSVHLGILEPVIAIFLIVALANAVNMTDVVDGVAGGVSAIAAAALALMSLTVGNLVATTVLLALSGALVGFLPHNFRTPKIFLGDTGSLGAGFILGAAALVGLQRDGTWLAVPALLALAVPLAELSLTILRRILRAMAVVRTSLPSERFVLHAGKPGLFVADRRHVPHRLLELGLHKRGALTVLYTTGACLGALGFAAVRWPSLGPLAGMVAVGAVIFFAPRWLYGELRILERGALLPLLENRLIRHRLVHTAYDAVVVFSASIAVAVMMGGWNVVTSGGAAAWWHAAVATAAALLGFWLAGLYRAAYRHAGISEALRATRSVVLGMVFAGGALTLLRDYDVTLPAWLLQTFLVLTGVMGARVSFRVLDHLYLQGQRGDRRTLIFGAGRGGDLALREIRCNPQLDLEPVGFLDDSPNKWGRRIHGLVVHKGENLEHLFRRLAVDSVIVSTLKIPSHRQQSLTTACLQSGVRLLSLDLSLGEMANGGIEETLATPEMALTAPVDVSDPMLDTVPTQPYINTRTPGNGHGWTQEP
jgi:UDP-GlcNAc:undecaprenyl-phosphate GlcNAc-1-phosphate transferase